MQTEDLVIAERFCGPPHSGNGGYVAGLVARGMAGDVCVRLKAPPPLDTPLRREWTAEAARLYQATTVLAEARSAALVLQPPPAPGLDEARQAAEPGPSWASHPFPRCFVCGPARAPGDGLRILPGLLPHGGQRATPWVPDPSLAGADGAVRPEFLWAALDCPGGLAVMPDEAGTTIVLGELTASLRSDVPAGEPVVVSAWPIGREGRRRIAGSALHRADGRLVAMARAVWIEVPAKAWTASEGLRRRSPADG